jgi:hypothetical protein
MSCSFCADISYLRPAAVRLIRTWALPSTSFLTEAQLSAGVSSPTALRYWQSSPQFIEGWNILRILSPLYLTEDFTNRLDIITGSPLSPCNGKEDPTPPVFFQDVKVARKRLHNYLHHPTRICTAWKCIASDNSQNKFQMTWEKQHHYYYY